MSATRDLDQLRPVKLDLDYVMYPEGSVLISMGNTRVLCNATVEESLPRWLQNSKQRQGWVTAEYAMLPRATEQRNQREIQYPQGRTQEIQRLIARSLRAAVDLPKLGDRQIVVDCDVLQADGGTRTASITGGYVALALAIKRLEKRASSAPGVLQQAVAAVSVGVVNGKAVLDLNYSMDQKADVDMNVVMTSDGRFVEVQGTAEGEPFQPRRAQRHAAARRARHSPTLRFPERSIGQRPHLTLSHLNTNADDHVVVDAASRFTCRDDGTERSAVRVRPPSGQCHTRTAHALAHHPRVDNVELDALFFDHSAVDRHGEADRALAMQLPGTWRQHGHRRCGADGRTCLRRGVCTVRVMLRFHSMPG